MLKKIKKKFNSRFMRVWIILFILVIAGLAARMIYINQSSPTIKEVLNSEVGKSPDFSAFLLCAVAFSMLALSLAKGYEIFKRGRATLLDEPKPQVNIYSDSEDKFESLEKNLAEAKKSKDDLVEHNMELSNRLRTTISEFETVKQIEQILRKSNIALGRECERLKSENEQLMLKVNSEKIKPHPKTVAEDLKAVSKTKAAKITKSAKKSVKIKGRKAAK